MGEEAMLAAIKKQFGRCPREIIERVEAETDKFADGAKQHDDMTMIVLTVS
jgi:serine phosphatase RsbU (regulator of sigma subunit)